MKKYLERLEKEIWISKERDSEIYQCLQCEISKCVDIQLWLRYEDDWLHKWEAEMIYKYEKEYKEQVLELLTKIENNE